MWCYDCLSYDKTQFDEVVGIFLGKVCEFFVKRALTDRNILSMVPAVWIEEFLDLLKNTWGMWRVLPQNVLDQKIIFEFVIVVAVNAKVVRSADTRSKYARLLQ